MSPSQPETGMGSGGEGRIDEDMPVDNVMDQLPLALSTGDFSNINLDDLVFTSQLDAVIIELGRLFASIDVPKQATDGSDDPRVDHGIEIKLADGTQVKAHNYLLFLAAIIDRLLKNPESKVEDFDRLMKLVLAWGDGFQTTILDLVFDIMVKCKIQFMIPILLPSHLPSTKVGQTMVSLKDYIVPIMSAFIFRLSVDEFKTVERILIKNLLSNHLINVVVSQEILCLIARSNDNLRVQHVDLLMKIHDAKISDQQRINVELLTNRLLRFHADLDWDAFLSKYDICNHPYLVSGLKNIDQATLSKIVMKFTVKYFSNADQVGVDQTIDIDKVTTIAELISYQDEPRKELVDKILSILINTEMTGDFGAKESVQVRQRLLDLSKYLKIHFINEILPNSVSQINQTPFTNAYFIVQMLNQSSERIAKYRKYQKSILVNSFKLVDHFIDNGLIVSNWLQFAHKFCTNVADRKIVAEHFGVHPDGSSSTLRVRELFRKYLSKSQTDSPSDETEMVNKWLNDKSMYQNLTDVPTPLLVAPRSETPMLVPEPMIQVVGSDPIKQELIKFKQTLSNITNTNLPLYYDDLMTIKTELDLILSKKTTSGTANSKFDVVVLSP